VYSSFYSYSLAGGISEVGFQFDLEGNLWGVGRNEDGDDSGKNSTQNVAFFTFILAA
jgi:hypothetical protein